MRGQLDGLKARLEREPAAVRMAAELRRQALPCTALAPMELEAPHVPRGLWRLGPSGRRCCLRGLACLAALLAVALLAAATRL